MIKTVNTRHAGYLSEALGLEPRNLRVKWACKKLKEIRAKTKIHAIVVRGVSGMAIGTIVSFLEGLPLIVVRKGTEDCHSSYTVEANFDVGEGESLNFVVIDDLISTGQTMLQIGDAIQKEIQQVEYVGKMTLKFRFVAILLYGYGSSHEFEFNPGNNYLTTKALRFGYDSTELDN